MPLYAEEQQLEIAIDGERVALFTLPAVPLIGAAGREQRPERAGDQPDRAALPAEPRGPSRTQPRRRRVARARAGQRGRAHGHGDVHRAHGGARRAGALAVRAAVSGRRQHSGDAHRRVSARRRDQRPVRGRPAPATRRAGRRVFWRASRPAPTPRRRKPARAKSWPSSRAARIAAPSPMTTWRRCSRSIATAPTAGFDAGIQLALKRLLVSPEFLFRVEQDPADAAPGSVYAVSDLTLASRLSFFLWSSIPDDELLAAAERGELRDPQRARAASAAHAGRRARDGVRRELRRAMAVLAQPRRRRAGAKRVSGFRRHAAPGTQARDASSSSAASCKRIAARSICLRADYTFVNERVARLYGLPNVKGNHFRRVTLPADSPRRGLLGQGSILTVTSYPGPHVARRPRQVDSREPARHAAASAAGRRARPRGNERRRRHVVDPRAARGASRATRAARAATR